MEIGENENQNPNIERVQLHETQSVPIFSSSETQDEGSSRKKSRRVSFASSNQLTRYLEPLNPFATLGKRLKLISRKFRRAVQENLLHSNFSLSHERFSHTQFRLQVPKSSPAFIFNHVRNIAPVRFLRLWIIWKQ